MSDIFNNREHAESQAAPTLKGRTVYYLGSSVTRGHGGDAEGVSFAEYLAEKYKLLYEKQAVSGTTLAVRKGCADSYVERADLFSFRTPPLAVIIQLSTNDFSVGTARGTTENDLYFSVTEAIKTLVGKIRSKCPDVPIAFYVCPLDGKLTIYGSYMSYARNQLTALSAQLNFDVIDLTKNTKIDMARHMQSDGLHPTADGYKEVFCPQIARYLINKIG